MSRKLRVAMDLRSAQGEDPDRVLYAIELVHGLRRRRIDLVLILQAGKKRPTGIAEMLGLRARIHEIDAPIGSVREQIRWPKVLRETACDVLIAPDPIATPWFSPVPVVAIFHGALYEENMRLAPTPLTAIAHRISTRLALARAQISFTTSHVTRVALNAHYGSHIKRSHVIRPGMMGSISAFTSVPVQRTIVSEVIDLPQLFFLHVGSRRPAKRQKTLLAAFAGVASVDQDVGLVFVGPRDRRHFDPLWAEVTRLGLSSRVRILDRVAAPTLQALYNMAVAFVLPSVADETPTSMLQAMAAGTPIIASDIPMLRELTGGAAMLVPAGEVGPLRYAMEDVLANPAFRSRLAKAGRTASASRDWDDVAKKLMRAVNKLPTPPPRVPPPRLPVSQLAPPRKATPLSAVLHARRRPDIRVPDTPALGPTPPMAPKERRLRRTLLAFVALLAVIGVGARFAQAPVSERLPTIGRAEWIITQVAIRSSQPQDVDLVNIRDAYDVGAIVNLRSGGVVESVVAADLGLDYLSLTLPDRGAPTRRQLGKLVDFLVDHALRREVVLIHDETGIDRAPAVAAMIEMLRGTRTADAVAGATGGDDSILSDEQITAINELAASLDFPPYLPDGYTPPVRPDERYGDVSDLVW